MSEISTNRTTDLIAAEIINIKEQTKKMVIYNSIEIGRRLVEAKEIIEHGQWGSWLEKSVDYSQRTATNLMRIFEEYGSDQITLLNNNSKSQALASLSYTQAVALLGIPSEEREEFIQINDIEAMSTRELQKAIKDKEKAEEDKRLTDKVLRETQADFKNLQVALQREKDSSKKEINKLKENILEAKKQLSEEQASGDDEDAQELQSSPQEIQKNLNSSTEKTDELEEHRKKPSLSGDHSIIRFEIYCEQLQKTLSSQLELMNEIKKTNVETYDKCKNDILNLVNKISEGL